MQKEKKKCSSIRASSRKALKEGVGVRLCHPYSTTRGKGCLPYGRLGVSCLLEEKKKARTSTKKPGFKDTRSAWDEGNNHSLLAEEEKRREYGGAKPILRKRERKGNPSL